MKPTTRSAGAPESQASQDHADDRRSAAGFTRAPLVDVDCDVSPQSTCTAAAAPRAAGG